MNRLSHKILARFHVDPIGVAMPGPRLSQRVRKIIEARSSARISRGRVALLITTCVAVCAAFIVVTLSHAQAPQSEGSKMSFEVASVKQDKDGHPYSNFPLGPGNSYSADGGLLSANDMPVSIYIGFAYGLTA